MYLRMFNEVQRESYLRLAQLLLNIDGSVHPAEAAVLEAARMECGGLPLPKPAEPTDVPYLCASFGTMPEKMALLLESVGVVASDGVTTVEERGYIAQLGSQLGLPFSAAEKCFAWVEEMRAMQAKGLDLLMGK